ncbi:MAG: hypothetical protein C4334_05775 [Pyrinomonas sp.]
MEYFASFSTQFSQNAHRARQHRAIGCASFLTRFSQNASALKRVLPADRIFERFGEPFAVVLARTTLPASEATKFGILAEEMI